MPECVDRRDLRRDQLRSGAFAVGLLVVGCRSGDRYRTAELARSGAGRDVRPGRPSSRRTSDSSRARTRSRTRRGLGSRRTPASARRCASAPQLVRSSKPRRPSGRTGRSQPPPRSRDYPEKRRWRGWRKRATRSGPYARQPAGRPTTSELSTVTSHSIRRGREARRLQGSCAAGVRRYAEVRTCASTESSWRYKTATRIVPAKISQKSTKSAQPKRRLRRASSVDSSEAALGRGLRR